MSTFSPYRLECRCGHAWTVDIAYGIHITRLPWAREQILDGTFQVFTCAACGEATAVTGSTVYTDFDRHEYVAVEPAVGASWQSIRERNERVFDNSFTAGPPIAAEMGVQFRKRAVIGFTALREKLVIWNAALDDLVVEGVKADLADDLGLEPDEALFRLSAVLPGGHLTFARFEPVEDVAGPQQVRRHPRPSAVDVETVLAEDYQACRDRRGDIVGQYPWLGDDWLVDFHDGYRALRLLTR